MSGTEGNVIQIQVRPLPPVWRSAAIRPVPLGGRLDDLGKYGGNGKTLNGQQRCLACLAVVTEIAVQIEHTNRRKGTPAYGT